MTHAGHRSHRTSTNTRWFPLLAALSAIPFLLSAGYALLQISQNTQDDAAERLVATASITAQVVNERLASGAGALNALANSDAALRDDLPELHQQAQRLMGRMPENSGISLISPDGVVLFSTFQPFGSPTFTSSVPEVWKRVFEFAQPQVSEPLTNPINQQRVVALGVPVFQHGRVAYCINMAFTTHSINDLLMAQKLPTKWPVEVISQSGRLLAHSRPTEIESNKLASEEIIAASRANMSGLFNTTAKDGTKNRTVLARIGNFDWTVVITTPLDTLDAPVQHVVVLLFIYGGAFAVLGGLAVVSLPHMRKDAPSDAPEQPQPIATNNSRTLLLLGPALAALMTSILLGSYTAWLTQENLQRIADSVDSQQKNHAEQLQIEELDHLFNELEIGQRGFASTGNVVFLAFFSSASKQLPALIARIKTEFSKPDQQEFNWTEFDILSEQYTQFSAEAMSLRKTSGAPFRLEDALYTDGKLVLDKLRLQVDEMGKRLDKRIERGAIHIASQREHASQQQWLSTFAVSALFSISVAIWLYERQRRMHIHWQLEMSHQLLENRVAQRTHDLATANQRIRSNAQEMQALIDSERKRLSRDVHDQIGQIFTAIKMIMGAFQSDRLDTALKSALTEAVNSGATISRRIAAELRPPLLDDFGFNPAFEHFLKTICEPARLGYEFQFPAEFQIANPHMTELFRIMQAGCVNVVAHANAMHLEVVGTVNNNMLEVCIDDDGVGFDPAYVRAGALGILGMQERAKLIDAKIDFAVSPMGGTRVHIVAPLMHSEKSAKI